MSDERGFTLVEVLVAFFILMVGMAGTALMLNTANAATAGTKAREQAIGLQREVVEAARSVPYDQLAPATVVPAVQAKPGLGKLALTDTSWKVSRGGVIYTVTLGACSVDDDSDEGIGAHDAASFCATSATDTTPARCRELLTVAGSGQPLPDGPAIDVGRCGIDLDGDGAVDNLVEARAGCDPCSPTPPADQTPDDYKRIVTLVTWDRGTGGKYALQSATVPNPGSAAAIRIDTLTRAPATVAIGPGTSSVSFSATPSRPPAAVAWSVNGAIQEIDPAAQPALSWQWPLGEVDQAGAVLDGSYIVGARAADASGIAGPTRSMTIAVNRRQPKAPAGFVAGRNSDAVEFEWTANQERDIEGYRVYRVVGDVGEPACELTRATNCRLLDGADGDYYVVAVDRTTAGVLREGDVPLEVTPEGAVTTGASSPDSPSDLTATREADAVTLSWTPSPSTEVEFYRIYRDGQLYEHRYDRMAGTADADGLYRYVDTQTDGVTHSYSITAVNSKLGESAMLGPVTR
ncbi:MAG: prepilin-type N-terminal cleavage/methylation domain-containing protein [Solirubrobacteraceae bacterium MAG38_C4-C5]|nr:prepilin-type N-terminal cleavage/methylation domain-containing protein [Candidatus Siliceabacter maunaloa]